MLRGFALLTAEDRYALASKGGSKPRVSDRDLRSVYEETRNITRAAQLLGISREIAQRRISRMKRAGIIKQELQG